MARLRGPGAAARSACALRGGYRVCHMRDADGCKIAFCKLLVHVRSSHTHLPYALQEKHDEEPASGAPSPVYYDA